ncbi:MAG: hypothetical protein HY788_17605 [Deltaproteobacteria bacterium]|nr:hypothetical protein [Deltaproteobacteria bacterium]
MGISGREIPSAEQLYETILGRQSRPLPGLEEVTDLRARNRAARIHCYLAERASRLDEECLECGRKARKGHTRSVFATPWDEDETDKYFCSEEHADEYLYTPPYAYFHCDPCGRMICEQNPKNGWHLQYRDTDDARICLACYQDRLLAEGLEFERGKLEKGQIPGMYFSWGNPEPKQAGYTEVPGFEDFYVNSEQKRERFIGEVLARLDSGEKVIACYESLAIGGSEGYATMMVKNEPGGDEE